MSIRGTAAQAWTKKLNSQPPALHLTVIDDEALLVQGKNAHNCLDFAGKVRNARKSGRATRLPGGAH